MLTDESKLRFKRLMRLTLSFDWSCELMGLSHSDFLKWVKTPDGRPFFEEVKQVEWDEIIRSLEIIWGAAEKGDSEALAWLMKHESNYLGYTIGH